MILHPPFIITSRLTPGVVIDGTEISLEPTGSHDHHGRPIWRWWIGEESGDDLSGPTTYKQAFADLLGFLGAFGEAQRYPNSDNRELFPTSLAEWAQKNDDEFTLLMLDLEGDEYATIEE